MKLRVKFSKHGVLRFIGHLDVMRYFQKAIRRAGIDIAYSAGFSPHQIMSFAAPLGVGLESNGEYMDIEVNSLTSSKEFIETLNAQMAAFREGYIPVFLTDAVVTDFFSQPEIIVTKQTKKGETTFDLKPFLYECTYDEAQNMLCFTVDASSSGNVKPALLLKAVYDRYNAEFDEFAFLITREETYLNIGTQESMQLKPLGFIGSDY